jgi:hypothetical protein
MTRTLEKAFAEAANLPAATQEQIGRDLLAHIRKLRRLRADIKKGLRSLDAGKGRELDIEEFLRRARNKH